MSRQFEDSWFADFAWLVYENGLMTCKICKTFPSMAGKSDFLKGCKTFKKETLKIHSEMCKVACLHPLWNTSQGLVVKGPMSRNMTQQMIAKLGFPETVKY